MRPLTTLLALATSALLSSAAPISTAGDSLTEETWDAHVGKGTCPYCSHCKAFAPKWQELVDTFGDAAASHDFHFAQVDCAANGDLCHSHDVKYYPSIYLYEGGTFKQEYEGRRTLEELAKFAEEHYPVKAEKLAKEKEEQEQSAKEGTVEEKWDKEEAELDAQVGMGERKKLVSGERRVAGAGKARLPTEAEEEKAAGRPKLPVMRIAGDTKAEEEKEDSATQAEDLKPLLEKAEADEAEYRSPLLVTSDDPAEAVSTPTTSTQTPPASTTTAAKFSPPAFVAQRPASPESKRSNDWPAIDGTVLTLKADEVGFLKEPDAPPAFVKFYAPWCSHCKQIAPKWKDLAAAVAPSGIRIYEMDCDANENKKACRKEGVKAYPTLQFYNKGASVEYMGKRSVDAFRDFALKAMSATSIKPIANEYELRHAAKEDEVFVLFLHGQDTKKDDMDVALGAAKSLMGSSPVYSSTSPDLFSLFSVPHDQPTFISFKDHSTEPYDTFALPLSTPSHPLPIRKRLDMTRFWLRAAKLPTVSELNAATFNDLLPTDGNPPLVGLAVLSKKGLGDDFDATLRSFERVAKGWAERRRSLSAEKKGRDVLWAWVDGDKWAGWARSMYDVKMGAKDGPRLVVTDPKALNYWSTTLAGEPLGVDSSAVYELIERGIYTGRTKANSSRQFLERFAFSTVDRFTSFYNWSTSHPLLAFLAVAASWIVIWQLLKKAITPPPVPSVPGPARGWSANGPKRDPSMVPDVARSPEPVQHAPRSPFSKFGGRKHNSSRSVSDPFGGPPPPSASLHRRSSFTSSPDLQRTPPRHAKKNSTLPSIRSLKTRFQSLGFGSFGGGSGSKGPKILRGEEAKAVGISAPQSVVARTGGGLKGFSGPAGSGIGRSVSHPAKLQDAGRSQETETPTLPQLRFSGDEGEYGGMHFDSGTKRSVDEVLSAGLASPTSPRSVLSRTQLSPIAGSDASPSMRLPAREAASPRSAGRPIFIAPKRRSPPSPLPPDSTSLAVPAPHDSPSPRTSVYSPAESTLTPAPFSAPVDSTAGVFPGPPPVPSRRLLGRISQDFARPPSETPLSILRAQQAAEQDTKTRSASRQSNRNSRILPGATLPSNWESQTLTRSKSAGATPSERRSRYWSDQLAPPVPAFSSPSSDGATAGTLRRRHSVSPVVTPQLGGPETEQVEAPSSPPVDAAKKEEHRGRSLSALLGQARASFGLRGSVSSMEGAAGQRRPSKPFPPQFEEVPITHATTSAQPRSSYPISPSSPNTPPSGFDSFPSVDSAAPPSQDRPESFSFADYTLSPVPPLRPRPSDASIRSGSSYATAGPAEQSAMPQPRRPSTTFFADPRQPSLHDPFTGLRKSKSVGSLVSPQPRVSSLQAMAVPIGQSSPSVYDESMQSEERPVGSPLGELIEELRARQAEMATEGVASPNRPQRPLEPEEEEDEDDEDERDVDWPVVGRHDSHDRSLREFSFSSSPGGEHPFSLHSYLDGSAISPAPSPLAPSPLAGRKSSGDPFLQSRPSFPPPPVPLPLTASVKDFDPTAYTSNHSSLPTFALSSPPPPKFGDSERPLTFEQMESEIARMEAELAASGHSSLVASPSSRGGFDTPVKSTPNPAHADPPSPSPGSLRAPSPAAALSPAATSEDTVTPRTARKWSIFEMEKAYERMKRLLSLSSASGPVPAYAPSEAGSTLEDGASFSGVDMDTALNNALEQTRGLVGEEEDEDAQEVLAVEEDEPTIEVESSSPTLVAPSPRRASAESTVSTIADKPLPGLPPPTPSPTSDSARAAVAKRSTDDSDVHLDPTNSGAETDDSQVDPPRVGDEDLQTGSSTVAQVEENEPTEADGRAAEAVEATTPDDEAAAEDEMAVVSEYEQDDEGEGEAQDEGERDEAEQKLPASQDEQAAVLQTSTVSADQPLPPATPSSFAHPISPSFVPTSPSTARRRTDSDASSTTGMRPLVLPITTRLRHRGTRDSIISLTSINDAASETGSVDEPVSTENGLAGFATPPTSPRNSQSAQPSPRATRYILHGLRSGAGRDLRRQMSDAGGEGSGEQQLARSLSLHQLPNDAGDAVLEQPTRRSLPRSTTDDASSWYPVTPERGAARFYRSEMRRRSRTGDDIVNEDDERRAATDDITSIRNMDKLEVFFKYTAVKAELDKAELERDALLDALRETRSTLSDVRSQRDNLDAELKREKQLTALVKQHLGGHPERVQEKLADLVDARQEWEMRARSAEEELDLLRHVLAEAREREELLERENVMMGARLASAEMARDGLAGSNTSTRTTGSMTAGRLPPIGHSRRPSRSSTQHSKSPQLISGLPLAASSASVRSQHSSSDTTRRRRESSLLASPTLTMSRTTSANTARPYEHSPSLQFDASRRTLKESFDSSASEMEPAALGLGDIGSPLMNQTLQSFGGAKSSYGSDASPLKNRSPPSHHYDPSAPPSLPFATLDLRGSKMSSDSTQTDEYSEYADQSFDSSTGVEGLARLKRADAAFLSDLTGEIELSPEDARGRRVGE
ncbi:Proteophosphoglycan ppg4 [Rhodotorula toruloides ATCC 204091]|uniref:BY PROTMAP: gi/342321065/gb/EGU13003.1/ Proteophosphoglycan ppg4 [Rhodotorula glutinis ATCC 204091] n=2 Tax=Rhodotorula toruloides TaxID=5286 RepID=A0A0K3CJ11_RHOTO|nr:Proteophosphoglycan ppg4 [Rhodotorula toruloides ATCC 204091]